MKKIKKGDLLITPSLYSLFLYFLLNKNWEKSEYVLHCRIPQLILSNLKKTGAEVYVDFAKGQGNTVFDKLKQNVLYLKYLNYSKDVDYARIYGNDEFYLSMKYRHLGIRIIEDGPYYNDKVLLKKRRTKIYAGLLNYWFYWIFKNYIPWGFDKRVSVFYHTPTNILPDEIANKGVLIDMQQLWNEKTEVEKRRIMQIFGIEPSVIRNICRYKKILITQTLPISDDEKIDIYKSMLSENGINQSELLIKTHYAEKVNYRAIFPQAMVIDAPVPAQLFDLMGYEADVALTIASSAIFAFIKPQTKVIFKGTEFHERLKEHYGVLRLNDFIK